jgi:two-component system, chemotaxis family, chemotaxis protein CheY
MAEASKPSNIYKRPPIGIKPGGGSYTAFLIDDSPTARAMLKQILLSLDFKVLDEAENGEMAIRKLTNAKIFPDFVFVDMEMPHMDGFETVKQMRPLLPDAKVILVTSHGEKETVMEALNMGLSGYIKKPYDRETVVKKISQIMGLPLYD